MKLTGPVLALSLVANVGLAALTLDRWTQRRTSAPPAGPAVGRAPEAAAVAPAVTEPRAVADDDSYVARLRAEGFPPSIVRALAEARVYGRYADRLRRFRPAADDVYWRSQGFLVPTLSREDRTAQRAIYQELQEEIARLMGGEEATLAPAVQARRERAYGSLAPAKVRQIEAIGKDYNELRSEILGRANGLVLRADRDELRLLEREQRRDLAALLTPEELVEYDLRGSPSAAAIRSRLRYFTPTEEEFRALTRLQVDLDLTFGGIQLSAEEQARRAAEEKEQPAKIAAALGPERYADYLVTTDGMYRDTATFVQAQGLEVAAAKEVVALKRRLTAQADALRTAPPEQRAAAMAALEREALTELGARLGGTALAAYRKEPTSGWLARFAPPAKR